MHVDGNKIDTHLCERSMTLNITVAARWLMVQSSDFYLTQEGATQPVSETAQKQIVLQYMGWSGLICYTGIARWGLHETAAWLEDVLTHQYGERTPNQVTKLVAEKGTVWLKRIPAKDRCLHTFTMIAYERDRAHIYLISNQEQLGRPDLAKPADTFMISHARVRGTTCVVTGWKSVVTARQKKELERQLASNVTPLKLREAVAFVNREAASRAKDKAGVQKVGEECVVAHLLPDGSGEAQVFGNLTSEFLPAMISNGRNVAIDFSPVLRSEIHGPARLVGVTWTSNGQATAMLAAYRDLSKQTGTGWPEEESE